LLLLLYRSSSAPVAPNTGELTYREYNRTIESESGPVNVQWLVAEIVAESIKVLDRKSKENNEMEGAA